MPETKTTNKPATVHALEVSKKKNGAQIQKTEPESILQIIANAAKDESVSFDKMRELLALQERVMAVEARIEFNNAMARLQSKLPVIKKVKAVHHNGVFKYKFAPYDEIFKKIGSHLAEEGFSVSYNTRQENGAAIWIGKVLHVKGHFETAETPPLMPDASGGKNAIQATSSTGSYAKRILIGMLINLVFEDEDDDGQTAEPITEEQIKIIEALLGQTHSDRKKFLTFAKAESVPEIQRSRFDSLCAQLTHKLQTLNEAK